MSLYDFTDEQLRDELARRAVERAREPACAHARLITRHADDPTFRPQ